MVVFPYFPKYPVSETSIYFFKRFMKVKQFFNYNPTTSFITLDLNLLYV